MTTNGSPRAAVVISQSASKGIYGINAIAQGQSAENIAADCYRIGGAWHLIINEARPAMLTNDFANVVYRFKGQGIHNDDDILSRSESEVHEIVRVLHAMCPVGHLSFGNEPSLLHSDGSTNWAAVQRLVKVTGWAQDEADQLGRQLVIFNTSVGHLRVNMIEPLRPTVERAKRRGDMIGHHVYYHRSPFDPYNMQRGVWDWLTVQEVLGGQWFIGEWGYAHELHPHRGWRDYISADEYRQHFVEAAKQVFVPRGIPAMTFCRWNDQDLNWRTFDIRGEMTDTIAVVNASAPYTPPIEDEGVFQPALITWTSSKTGVNMRNAPRLTGTKVATLNKGDMIGVLNPAVIIDSPTDMYNWVKVALPAVTEGTAGGGAVRTIGYIADEVFNYEIQDAEETGKDVLGDFPYVSQLGADANAKNNDCPAACALMVWQWQLQQHGIRLPKAVTVNRMVSALPALASGDQTSQRSDVVQFLDDMGVPAVLMNDLTIESAREEIKRRRPVIALVAYRHIVPSDPFDGGHYIVIYGVSDQFVYLQDPYKGGPNMRLSHAQFAQALSAVIDVGASWTPNVGIRLADAA